MTAAQLYKWAMDNNCEHNEITVDLLGTEYEFEQLQDTDFNSNSNGEVVLTLDCRGMKNEEV